MDNRLVCKNPSAPTTRQPHSSTPRPSSKNGGWARKRKWAHGNSLTLLRNQYNYGDASPTVGRRKRPVCFYPLWFVLPFLLPECLRTTIISQKPLQMLLMNTSPPHAHTHRRAHTCTHTPSMAFVCKGTFRERASFICQVFSRVICVLALQQFL